MGRRFVYFGRGVPSFGKHVFASFDVVALRTGSDEFRRLSITTRQISTPRPRTQLPGFLLAQPQLTTDKEGQSHTDFRRANAYTRNSCVSFEPGSKGSALPQPIFTPLCPSLLNLRLSVACFKGNKFLHVMSKVWADSCF